MNTADASEIAKLKAELHRLNCHIQAERNDEVRHALQRSRLERERAETLAKLMDACIARKDALPQQPSGVSPAAVVVLGELPSPALQASQKHKPDGMPTLKTMVRAAFEGHTELKTDQIFDFVRRRWWPTAPRNRVRSTIWKMCADGQLEKGAGVYRLNGHG
jgi:hypothetical protein